jgi:hypothetical protein
MVTPTPNTDSRRLFEALSLIGDGIGVGAGLDGGLAPIGGIGAGAAVALSLF